MNRMVCILFTALLLITLSVSGCEKEELPCEEEQVVSTCVACHTDKEILQEVASSEPAEEVSAETSGEG